MDVSAAACLEVNESFIIVDYTTVYYMYSGLPQISTVQSGKKTDEWKISNYTDNGVIYGMCFLSM